MNITCSDGWHNIDEFSIIENCVIPYIGEILLKILVIILCGSYFSAETIIYIFRYNILSSKKLINKILLIWIILNNLLMMIRPILGLFSIEYKSINYISIAILIGISGASSAGIVILFVYIQVRLLERASMKSTKLNNILFRKRAIILGTIGLIQAIIFIFGPLLYYFGKYIKLYHSFWFPVMLIDCFIIPYFCILGLIIFFKLKNMIQETYNNLAISILIMIIICTILGIFTNAVSLYAMIGNHEYDWILIELCWIADVTFNIILFSNLSKNKKKKIIQKPKNFDITTSQSTSK